MKKFAQKTIRSQKGQSLVEYLIIVAIVAVGSIALMRAVGQNLNALCRCGLCLGRQRRWQSPSWQRHHSHVSQA